MDDILCMLHEYFMFKFINGICTICGKDLKQCHTDVLYMYYDIYEPVSTTLDLLELGTLVVVPLKFQENILLLRVTN